MPVHTDCDSELVNNFKSCSGQILSGVQSNIMEATNHDLKFKVEELNFYYGAVRALSSISIDIEKLAITALIGPSGCGKSTFLRCLNRMNDPIPDTRIEGQVLLDGEDIYQPGLDPVDLRRRVGMVFQKPNPFPQTVFDNVAYGPRVLGLTKNRSELEAVVERSLKEAVLWDVVGERLDQDALGLSLGEQQRLCIARVIAVEPEVILMDEPTSALDPIATLEIENLMTRLVEHYTIVVVTHNMQQAARVSAKTGLFWLGELVEFDYTSVIFTRPKEERTEAYITGRVG
jgi:phosphate transport system ATP-binding protein